MKILATKEGHEIHIYSDENEMPIGRYNKYQKMLLIEAGVGSTIEAIDGHYTKQISYITTGNTTDAIKEAENTRHSLLSVMSGISYSSLAFACMTAKIDALPCEDITDDGLERTVTLLQNTDLTQGEVLEAIEDLKKK